MAAAPQQLQATTDNGSVEVVIPDTPDTYAVSVDTDNGNVRNESAPIPRVAARSRSHPTTAM